MTTNHYHDVSLLQEDRLKVSLAARELGVNRTTVQRWLTRGIGGVVLETYLLGGRRYTTCQAVARFVERRSAATPSPPEPHTNRQREAAIRRAEAEIDRLSVSKGGKAEAGDA